MTDFTKSTLGHFLSIHFTIFKFKKLLLKIFILATFLSQFDFKYKDISKTDQNNTISR